nr:MAG TPA: hypothetical protein [Caudoviricetes sp.]
MRTLRYNLWLDSQNARSSFTILVSFLISIFSNLLNVHFFHFHMTSFLTFN